jgi:hypothetical protein
MPFFSAGESLKDSALDFSFLSVSEAGIVIDLPEYAGIFGLGEYLSWVEQGSECTKNCQKKEETLPCNTPNRHQFSPTKTPHRRVEAA